MNLLSVLLSLVVASSIAGAQEKISEKRPPKKRVEKNEILVLEKTSPLEEDSSAKSKPVEKKPIESKPATEPELSTTEKIKETSEEAIDYGVEKAKELDQELAKTRFFRENSRWTITGNYSLFEMWVLTKYGITVGYNRSAASTYELEYMRGSLGFGYFGLDIGEISEQRLGLRWRTYSFRNSFNFTMGVYYNWLDIHLGNEMLSSVSGYQTQVDLMKLETFGVSWGVGNRWQTKKGFVWGADWFSVNLPVFITKQEHPFIEASNSAAAREDADDTMKILRRIPSLAVLKVQLGFSF